MKIKGIEGIIQHLPDYTEKQAKRIILRLPAFTVIFILVQILLVNFSSIMFSITSNSIWVDLEPIFPVICNIIFIFFGTVIAQTGFRAKKRLIAENPETAYQSIIKTILGGISMGFSGIIFPFIPRIKTISNITLVMYIPYDTSTGLFLPIIRLIIGIIILILGVRTAFKAVQTFGIDTASLVYVYYPEDADIVDHEIYSVVRHPMYLSMILISTANLIIYFSIFSTLMFVILLLSLYKQIVLEEEKELIERFGDSYIEYSKKVPALLIRPKNWKVFFKFLF